MRTWISDWQVSDLFHQLSLWRIQVCDEALDDSIRSSAFYSGCGFTCWTPKFSLLSGKFLLNQGFKSWIAKKKWLFESLARCMVNKWLWRDSVGLARSVRRSELFARVKLKSFHNQKRCKNDSTWLRNLEDCEVYIARPARKCLSTAARRPLSCLALVSHRPLSEIARTVPFGVLLNSCEPGNARDVSSMFTAAGRSYRRCHCFI